MFLFFLASLAIVTCSAYLHERDWRVFQRKTYFVPNEWELLTAVRIM